MHHGALALGVAQDVGASLPVLEGDGDTGEDKPDQASSFAAIAQTLSTPLDVDLETHHAVVRVQLLLGGHLAPMVLDPELITEHAHRFVRMVGACSNRDPSKRLDNARCLI